MAFLDDMDPATGLIVGDGAKARGEALSERYNAAAPFPHIVIDDFLPPPILAMCLREFTPEGQDDARQYNRAQERLKREYKPDQMSPGPRNLFYTFNSRPFIQLIQAITGIKGLIPDPYFSGGGFHEISNGGHLSMHADFNHHVLMNLERRLNVLIYLNDGWEDSYGGQLELWDEQMGACVQSIVPILNRCVIFNTTSTSYHGNPHPVQHPAGITRKSIALYYYTATWDGTRRRHTTQFKPRPGSADKPDTQVRLRELIEDVTPPALLRGTRRLLHSLRGGGGKSGGTAAD